MKLDLAFEVALMRLSKLQPRGPLLIGRVISEIYIPAAPIIGSFVFTTTYFSKSA